MDWDRLVMHEFSEERQVSPRSPLAPVGRVSRSDAAETGVDEMGCATAGTRFEPARSGLSAFAG